MNVVAALTPVVEALEKLGVAYHIGGSVASSVHGTPRSTNDVDLVADLGVQHVEPLCQELRGAYYAEPELAFDAIRHHCCFNLIHLATSYKIDIFVRGDSAYDRMSLQRHARRQLDELRSGRTFLIATPEDILLRKLQWFRAGDEVSDRKWRDVLGVLRAQMEHLDHAYLYLWARELKVEDLLARAEQEVGNSRDGWVVGDEGTILRTTNGGASWTEVRSRVSHNLNKVVFNGNRGFAIGMGGTLLATGDGIAAPDEDRPNITPKS